VLGLAAVFGFGGLGQVRVYVCFLAVAGGLFFVQRRFCDRRWFWAGALVLFSVAIDLTFVLFNGVLVGDNDLSFYYTQYTEMMGHDYRVRGMYSALFPGTVTYPALLTFVSKLFGLDAARHLIPIGLNIAVMAVFAGVAFLCFSGPGKGNGRGFALGLLLCVNPYKMIYAATVNAELLFGACVFFSVAVFDRARRSEGKASWALYAGSAALCAVSALFRPLGLILVAAVCLYLALFSGTPMKRVLPVCGLFIVSFWLVGLANNGIVKNASGFDIPKRSYGWNLYVGASETGTWNSADGAAFEEMMAGGGTPDEIMAAFADKAFRRYKAMGLGAVPHGLEKLSRLFPATAYLQQQLPVKTRTAYLPVLSAFDAPVMILGLLGLALALWRREKGFVMPLIALYVLGNVAAFMFLEVAPRYFVSFHLLMCVPALYFVEWFFRGGKRGMMKNIDKGGTAREHKDAEGLADADQN
jgi:hypothetical protein